MDNNIAAVKGITDLAPNASFYEVLNLRMMLESVKEAFDIALDLSEVPDQTIVDFSYAVRDAKKAFDKRDDFHALEVSTLIKKHQDDLGLRPFIELEMVKLTVEEAGSEITHTIREKGEFVAVWKNGEKIGRVEAYCLKKDHKSFEIEGIGTWNYEDLRAFSLEDGFAFLLKDGTLFEAKQDS